MTTTPTDRRRGLLLGLTADYLAGQFDLADLNFAAACCPPDHPNVRQAFLDLVDAVNLRWQWDAGVIGWEQVDERLTGPDKQTACAEITDQRVEDALNALLRDGVQP